MADTGVFFDRPDSASIAQAVRDLSDLPWDSKSIADRASEFTELSFSIRLEAIVQQTIARDAA